jgi:hypothetical protein
MNLQMFVAGMQGASEKHALLVKRAFIERTVHMKRENEKAENEIKKLSGSLVDLSGTLEEEKGIALGMKAEFLKMSNANK